MNKYALLIGNSEFLPESNLANLRCPQADIKDLAAVLCDGQRGQFTEVLECPNYPHQKIAGQLCDLLQNAGKDDFVLVYYSGHGLQQPKSGQLHLATADTVKAKLGLTALGINRICEWIHESNCQKIAVILDCCHSSAAGEGFTSHDVEAQFKTFQEQNRGTYLFTASTNLQLAHEQRSNRHSLFIKHLINGLQTGAADKHGKGMITLDDWLQYVQVKVREENPHQQPARYSKDKHGALVIALSGNDKKAQRQQKIIFKLTELIREDRAFIEVLYQAKDIDNLSIPRLELLNKLVSGDLTPVKFIRAWETLSSDSAPNTLDLNDVKLVSDEGSVTIKEAQESLILPVQPTTRPRVHVIKQTHTHLQQFTDMLKNGEPAPQMVWLQGGTFTIGSPRFEQGHQEDEQQKLISLDGFAIGRYAVTFEEYDAYVLATGVRKPECEGWGRGKRPVINVDWWEAMDYCDWLSGQTGHIYRLPTEAQWEYACRAGTKTAFYCGNTISTQLANYQGGSCTMPVGSFPPNPWGFYDMHGNVWEWTCSGYEKVYAGKELAYIGDRGSLQSRVLRGGSWCYYRGHARASYRYYYAPDGRNYDIGFRVCCVSPIP